MKQFVLGVLTVILVQGINDYVYLYSIDNDLDKVTDVTFKINETLTLSAVSEVLTGRCTTNKWRSDGTTARQWFNCNKIQTTVSDWIY
jgi:hypothetical protein